MQFIPQQELILRGSFIAGNKKYNGNSRAILTSSSLVLDYVAIEYEDVSIANLELNFDDKNVGTDKTVSITDYQLMGRDSLKYRINTESAPTAPATILPKRIWVHNAVASNKGWYSRCGNKLYSTYRGYFR